MHLAKDGTPIKSKSLGNGGAQARHFLEEIPRGIIHICLLLHPSFRSPPKNTFPSSTAPLRCLSLLAATVQLWNCCWGLLTSRPSPKQRLSKRGWTRSDLGSFVLYNYAWSGGPLYPNYPNIVGLEFPPIYPSDSVFPAQLHHQIGGPLGIPFWITKLKFKTPAMLAVDVFFCGNVGVPHQNCNLPEVGNMISTNFTDKNWIHFRITLTEDELQGLFKEAGL